MHRYRAIVTFHGDANAYVPTIAEALRAASGIENVERRSGAVIAFERPFPHAYVPHGPALRACELALTRATQDGDIEAVALDYVIELEDMTYAATAPERAAAS